MRIHTLKKYTLAIFILISPIIITSCGNKGPLAPPSNQILKNN